MGSPRDIITLGILFVSLYFEVFILITYLERRKIMHGRVTTPAVANPAMPEVTIIVPCYNEQDTVVKTIESLLALDYPKEKLFIMAVNDGSTDNTATVLDQYQDHLQIEVIHKENGGKHTAMNLAIEHCQTEFVGCLDADSYAQKDSLTRIMKRFAAENDIMAVVPSLHIYKPNTFIQRLQKVEYVLGVFLRSVLAELNALYVTPGPFSIFRTSVFKEIGPYRKAHNTEDMEMALRMQSHGMKIANAHDAVVYTSSPSTIPKLYTQRVRWTSGFLHNVRDYRHMLLDPRYGHVSSLVLPVMLVSTLSIIFIVISLMYDLGYLIQEWALKFDALGLRLFEWSWGWPHFDWFYLRTSPIILAGTLATLSIFVLIFIGSRLSQGSKLKIFDILCYTFLYAFIAPFWIIKSVANVIMSKQAAWR